jgi:N-acetylglucosamine-6-sulfatase
VIRPPGRHATRAVDALALNIDVAPTIADLAGVDPPRHDGRSLVPLLTGNPEAWRDRFVVEFLGYAPGVPPYSGIRTDRYLYVEYENGWRELYDLRFDPWQLRNLLPEEGTRASPGIVAALRASMKQITES